jgi:hypothetical protein
VTGASPRFADFAAQDFQLTFGSPCIDAGIVLPSAVRAAYPLLLEYLPHQQSQARPSLPPIDMGAFEFARNLAVPLSQWSRYQ